MGSLATKNTKSTELWPKVRLGDVCETINGLWKGVKDPLINVGIIRATNFTKTCEFSLEKTVYVDVEEKKFRARQLRHGDLIVERSGGGPGQPVGRVVYFNVADGLYSVSNFTSILRVNDTQLIDAKFLQKYLTARYFQGGTEAIQSNTTGLHNLDFDAFLNFEIPLPPLSVQKEIVARLEKELAAVDRMEKGFEKLAADADALFKAELKEAFEEVKRSGAETKRLGDVCEILDSKRKPITKRDRQVGDYPYYGATGQVDCVAGYIFDEKLVLLGEDGAKWGSGDASAFIIEGKTWVNNHAHVLRPVNHLHEFLTYYLNDADLTSYITGVTVPKLNQQKMCEIEIPTIEPSVQSAIVANLDAVREKCAKLKSAAEEGLKTAALMRKAILKEAFE